MSDLLEYKGYEGTVEYDAEEGILHGHVLFVASLLLYHGVSVAELKEAFQSTIDDYLAYCERAGIEPNKPCSGTFNVRIGPDRHRKLAARAAKHKRSINDLVGEAIDLLLDDASKASVQNHVHLHFTGKPSEQLSTGPSTWLIPRSRHASTHH